MLLVWLAAAMFRFCVLVQVVRQLAGRMWGRATPAEENDGQQRAIRVAGGRDWCSGAGYFAGREPKSMVRALILTRPVAVQSWMVSLLYQFRRRRCSDAAAQVQLCTGQETTPQTALTEAERGLPRKASYRICDICFMN